MGSIDLDPMLPYTKACLAHSPQQDKVERWFFYSPTPILMNGSLTLKGHMLS